MVLFHDLVSRWPVRSFEVKSLVLVGDGMADFPLDSCAGQTPLAAAKTPAMDKVAQQGISALFCPIPDGYPAGSDIGNLSLFGYNPDQTFTGRAPLEAANQGIDLASNQLAFRCNLVTLRNGIMEDFTAGHIRTEEASELIDILNDKLDALNAQFHTGVSYRHLTIVTPPEMQFPALSDLKCTPPHDITGQEIAPHLPQGEDNEPIRSLMTQSQDILKGHPVNQRREDAGKPPATSIWLWGQGKAPAMKTYPDLYGINGAVISAVDLVNGIGRCAGLEVITVPGATGYLDTNYAGKVSAALDALNDVDFVYLHVEAPDEASHEGKVDLKLQAIEDFDQKVVAPCLAHALDRGDCRVLVAPDHITAISTRTHASGPVPFALCGPGVQTDERTSYSEQEAEKSGISFPRGHDLVPQIISAETIASA
jgi:2,3-bisphosphoglycerate-independent phosphoglycerate mutase